MVDQVVGRVLGRPSYGEAERRSWSIRIAEVGFEGFIDEFLDSKEYVQAFEYDRLNSGCACCPAAPLANYRLISVSHGTAPNGVIFCKSVLPARTAWTMR